jgi:hypothetical protein
VILFLYTFVDRDISIGNGRLSGTEWFTRTQIRLENEMTVSISNRNYLSIETATGPTYNFTVYFLCAKSNRPVCGTWADYSRGGYSITSNISGDFSLIVSGRHKASQTIAVKVEIDKGSSVDLNNTVSQVYGAYRTTCQKIGIYYIRYIGFIDISTLTRAHNREYISVEINKTCS